MVSRDELEPSSDPLVLIKIVWFRPDKVKLISLFTYNSLLVFEPASYKRVGSCVATKLT